MGLFDDLAVPARFNRLRKYFHGLGMYDLDPDYNYSSLVATEDQLLMAVFCNKYICTKEHAAIRAKYKHLDEPTPEDSDEEDENLERTSKMFQTLAKQRGCEIESLQKKLDAEIEAKNYLQHKYDIICKPVEESSCEKLEDTVKFLQTLVRQRGNELERLQKELDVAINAKSDLQYEFNMLLHKVEDLEKVKDTVILKDSDAENLERTIKVFETMVKQRGCEIESLQKKLDDEINAKHDLQYKHNMLLNKFRDSDESVLQTVVEDLRKKLYEAESSCKCLENTIRAERKDHEQGLNELQTRVLDLEEVINEHSL